MKKTYLAITFSFLLIFSCILSACNTYNSEQPPNSTTQESESTEHYSQQINDLKAQILELEQSNYISEIEREEEIQRLEKLIEELKKVNSTTNDKNSTSSKPSSPNTDNSDSDDNNKEVIEFIYTVNNNEAAVTGIRGNSKNIVIPSAIDGYKVTCIADEAFASSEAENITVPDTVTKIGWFVFKNCSNLKRVTIPSSVTSIGYSAFAQTNSDFSIACSSDSFAAKYAQSYGIDFAPI